MANANDGNKGAPRRSAREMLEAYERGAQRLASTEVKPVADRQMSAKARSIELTRGSGVTLFSELELSRSLDYLVKNMLEAGELSMIYGPPSSFKSFLAIDIGMHVALGEPWQGHRVQRAGVFYLALENAAGTQRRLIGQRMYLAERHGTVTQDVPLAISRGPLDLGSEDNVARLIEDIKSLGERLDTEIELVVIDTLARALGGGDENSPGGIGKMIRNLDTLRFETGAHVMLVHHVGKDAGRGPRGHSSLHGALDAEIEIKREPKRPARATVVKLREGEEGEAFSFELEPIEIGHDAEGDSIKSAVVRYLESAVDGATASGRRTQPEKALDALVHAIESMGADVRGCPGTRGVPLSTWREACVAAGVFATQDSDNIERSFRRIRKDLIETGAIGTRDDGVWLPVPANAAGGSERKTASPDGPAGP